MLKSDIHVLSACMPLPCKPVMSFHSTLGGIISGIVFDYVGYSIAGDIGSIVAGPLGVGLGMTVGGIAGESGFSDEE